MKTNNQTEHGMLELTVASAANEDGISTVQTLEVAAPPRQQAWSPYEVWRTRVKSLSLPNTAKVL